MASGSNVYKPKLTGILIAAILLVMVVIVILISTVLILSRVGGGSTTTAPTPVWTPAATTTSGSAPTTESPATTTSDIPDPTAPNPTEPAVVPSDTLSISKSAIYSGNLVQIDESHFYQREGLIAYKQLNAITASALGFGALSSSSSDYTLSKGNLYLTYDALAAFEAMTADLAKELGNALQVRNAYYYDANVTVSNFKENLESVEHSTALYVDLQAYENGKVFPLDHPTYSATYRTWLTENCWKYGYIHIRDTAKYSTFRYVGKAPAAAMEKNNWDLSEFLQKAVAYNFENPLKVNDGDGHEWWLYYVLADADTVYIPVLGDESAYTISGDGSTGFVVAINSSVFA